MKILSSRLFWGALLIIGGGLLLLDTFGIFKGGDLFWTLVFAIAGALFLYFYLAHREHWWAIFPGVILLSISALIGLNSFLPGFSKTGLSGTIILGGIALSFLLVYLVERSNWWAIIPAGVMGTIAIVAIIDSSTSRIPSAGIFFLGLGLTFALVAILPTSGGRMIWAWIPAAVLGLIGILVSLAAENMINYLWPIVLILGGIFLLVRAFRK